MTTIQRLQTVIPGQTAAWYSRIATEIDAGRMPMPNLEPTAVGNTKTTTAVGNTKTTTAVGNTKTTKPTAVGKDYTIPILKAIGVGLLVSYFVVFVSPSLLFWMAIGSFCVYHFKVKGRATLP